MSNATTKKVFRWFWAWNDEQEEQWLGEMARQGWHFRSSSLTGHTFVQGEPADMVYRMDFQSTASLPKKDVGEYLGLFRDAGWEHIHEFGGWHYFRTRAEGARTPEIFTDPQSRIDKYRRVLGLLVLILCILVASGPPLGPPLRHGLSGGLGAVYFVAFMLRGLALLVLATVTVRLGLHIRRLRRMHPHQG